MNVKIVNKSNNELPDYATINSSGVDLRADLSNVETIDTLTKGRILELQPGERALIPTGLYIGLPEGYEVQIRPRSGLALKHGITVLNTPGTIDAVG